MAEFRERIRVHIGDREFSVVGGKFQEMLTAVKQINGRRFVSELKVWQLPSSAEDVQHQLEISGYWLEGGTPVADTPQSPQATMTRPGGDRIRVTVQGHSLVVVGGSFQEMLAAVKNLPGRRFDGESKVWEIPGEPAVIKHLIETAGFQLEGAEKIPLDPVPPPEPANFGPPNAAPSPFEEPDFFGNEDIPTYESPDWWDDGDMLPPALEPPDWLEDELASRPPDDLPLFDDQPPSFVAESPHPAPATDTAPVSRGSDQIRIRLGGIPLVVSGGSFREMLAVVKKIPGRRFDGAEKVWDIPADVTLDSVQQLVKGAGFILRRG
jgi:hypothetical protein